MNCDCDRRCGSITMIIEWNTAVAHQTSFLTDGSFMHCNITSRLDSICTRAFYSTLYYISFLKLFVIFNMVFYLFKYFAQYNLFAQFFCHFTPSRSTVIFYITKILFLHAHLQVPGFPFTNYMLIFKHLWASQLVFITSSVSANNQSSQYYSFN